MITPDQRCPCGSGESYGGCCGPLHEGAVAPSAERLMRSRFSAFAIGDATYLLASWHPSTRPQTLELDDGVRWYRLDILGRTGGGLADAEGTVEFEAFYKGTERGSQRENSRFVRDAGRWSYLAAI
jgi:SEC-C motif-containing protein